MPVWISEVNGPFQKPFGTKPSQWIRFSYVVDEWSVKVGIKQ